ncbi:hypothetical protein SAMN05421874_102305 [Nonomuraea maritima]|uniref:Uncharacterized protein n=1 Tax=Nonomuraea maritima TaxID=683260 RepID=A0A1G8UWY8_9ACTN|nr:hypothetical protein [Nonomuraea maritima]SDJ58321.1 hypothetical protein SAMN05421874_102305 [Nonomuraea maritima]
MCVAWLLATLTAAAPLGPVAPVGPPVAGGLFGPVLPAEPAVALACEVTTPSTRPLRFRPQVKLASARVSVRGNLELTRCVSPDRSARTLRSGWATMRATAVASCTGARQVRGSALITWFDVTGRPAGTSRLHLGADRPVARHPADALLDGTVTEGFLAGERVRGDLVTTSTLLDCATRGVPAWPGKGRVTFG